MGNDSPICRKSPCFRLFLDDSCVSSKDKMNNVDVQKTRGKTKLVGSLFLGILVLLSVWISVAYFHVAYLEDYIANIIKPTGSLLRVTLIAALGGFIMSIPILRSLSRKDRTPQAKMKPIPQYRKQQVHPLFMTSRPARDTNFVIRKTKNRGKISRNRDGERLPPSYQE